MCLECQTVPFGKVFHIWGDPNNSPLTVFSLLHRMVPERLRGRNGDAFPCYVNVVRMSIPSLVVWAIIMALKKVLIDRF